ncbi:MAG TPA: hypothetical protein VNH18_06490 [Bryobacteraceae bacterium]|nr:hypothetical protein [Bryobacteraceae bacterium]
MNPLVQVIQMKQQAVNGYRAEMQQLRDRYAMLEKLCEVEDEAIATLREQVPVEEQTQATQGIVTQSPITPQAAQQMPLRRPQAAAQPDPRTHPLGCMCLACQSQQLGAGNPPSGAGNPPSGAGDQPPQYRYQSMQPFAAEPVHGNIYDAGVVIPDGGLHGRINTTGISQGAKAMEEI